MELSGENCLLRIYIGESDRHAGQPLHTWLVVMAHAHGLAGATVLRGMMGYGAGSRIHTARIERLAEDLPVVVELVDARAKLEDYLRAVEPALHGGLATLEKVEVRGYGK